MTNRFHQLHQDLHDYEKEHRYSNEEYFEREQRMKNLENELSTVMSNYDKIQRDQSMLNEQYLKCRNDLEQTEKSEITHREQVNSSVKSPSVDFLISI